MLKINKYFYRTEEMFDGAANYSTWHGVVLRTLSGCPDDEKFLRFAISVFVLPTVELLGEQAPDTHVVFAFSKLGAFSDQDAPHLVLGGLWEAIDFYIQRLISRKFSICAFRFALLSRADANYDKMYVVVQNVHTGEQRLF